MDKIGVLVPVTYPVNNLLVTVAEDIAVADCVPVTSPDKEPVKFTAVVALVAKVAVDALPFRLAVIMFAEKLPDASLFTIVDAVLEEVAAFAANSAECIFAALDPPTNDTTVADCVPVTSPDKEPVKLVDVIDVVDVVALPDKDAVMTFAEKLPDESLKTNVLGVSMEVAAR